MDTNSVIEEIYAWTNTRITNKSRRWRRGPRTFRLRKRQRPNLTDFLEDMHEVSCIVSVCLSIYLSIIYLFIYLFPYVG